MVDCKVFFTIQKRVFNVIDKNFLIFFRGKNDLKFFYVTFK